MEPKLLPARYSLAILFLACAFCCHAQSRVIEVHLEKQKPAVKSTIWAFPLEDDTVPLAELRPRATGLPDEWKAYSVTDDFPQALYQGFVPGRSMSRPACGNSRHGSGIRRIILRTPCGYF